MSFLENSVLWITLFYVSEWVIRIVMLGVVTRRRGPSSAMAWLLVIFIAPWAGLVIYLIIGERHLPKDRVDKHVWLMHYWEGARKRFRSQRGLRSEEVGEFGAVADLVERLGSAPPLGGNTVELIGRSETFIERLVADIDNARDHVHLLFYIYRDDAVGRLVGNALARAVQRGARCRLLVDAVGSRPMLRTLAPSLRARGINVCAALRLDPFRRYVTRADLRNHRKLAIIDGRAAWAGSHNIVDPSYGHTDLTWHDLSARLTGPIVLALQALFIGDWFMESDEMLEHEAYLPEPEPGGDAVIQLLPSGPTYHIENYQRLVVAALHNARSHVVITTPYFVPDQAFMQAVQVAVLRGVKVEIVVPQRSDQILAGNAGRAYYAELLEYGAHIHLHTDGLLHSKTMTIDDAMCFFGSSNFDIRSFALNFEVNLVFYSPKDVNALLAEQRRYIRQSVPLVLEEWLRRPPLVRLFQNVTKLLSPLL